MTPMAMPARKARGNDAMPAMTAAARARVRVLGPRLSRFWADPAAPASRESDSVARPPAMAHTRVDTAFGLMPARRARSGLSAEAFTALPIVVRLRSHPRPTASRGTTMRMVSDGPVIRMSAISRTAPMGTGKRAPGASISGNEARMASESWAMPMVATSTITRGAVNSRRITISSTTAP